MRYLEEHRITMAAAAKAAGMAPQNIKKCLTGNPKIENIMAVANGLGIDPRDFFYTEADANTGNKNGDNAPATLSYTSDTTPGQSQPSLQATTFCPHCGARVEVGVVLLAR